MKRLLVIGVMCLFLSGCVVIDTTPEPNQPEECTNKEWAEYKTTMPDCLKMVEDRGLDYNCELYMKIQACGFGVDIWDRLAEDQERLDKLKENREE